MKIPQQNERPRVLCPRGEHLCRCVQVIDLGTQHFNPGDNGSQKLYLGFETCDAKHVFDEKRGPEPFMLQREFPFFMGKATKKSKLRLFIEEWFGREFPSDESANSFDPAKLAGRAAIITVAHKPKMSGGFKSEITAIRLPDAGQQAPAPVNPVLVYEIAERQGGCFARLPGFLRTRIAESDEFEQATNVQGEIDNEPVGEEATEQPDAGESFESAAPVAPATPKAPLSPAATQYFKEVAAQEPKPVGAVLPLPRPPQPLVKPGAKPFNPETDEPPF